MPLIFQQVALDEELIQGTPDSHNTPSSPAIMASPILALPRQSVVEEEDPGHQVHELLQECETLYEAVSLDFFLPAVVKS